MKKKFISRVVLLLTAFVAVSGVCVSQQLELEKFISRECALFIAIEEPDAFLTSLEEFPFFSNPKVSRALEILQDQEYSLLGEDDVARLESGWADFKDRLLKLDSLSVVVHPDAESEPEAKSDEQADLASLFLGRAVDIAVFPSFSIVLEGSAENAHALEELLNDAKSETLAELVSYRTGDAEDNAGESAVGENDGGTFDQRDSDSENRSAWFAKYFNDVLERFVVKRVGDFVVISNDEVNADELIKRIGASPDNNFRSLSRHRSYQVVRNALEERSKPYAVRGFFVPEKFPARASELITQSLSFDPQTLRAGGFMVSLEPGGDIVEVGDEQYRPVIEWEFLMTFARPATEYGKIVKSFLPLEGLPTFSIPIAEAWGIGFDSRLRDEAFEETIGIHHPESEDEFETDKYDSEYEDSNSEDLVSQEYDEIEYNDFNDFEVYGIVGDSAKFHPASVADFSNARYEIWLADPDAVDNSWLEMYSVTDYKKMEAFFLARIKAEDEQIPNRNKYAEVENEFGRLFAKDYAAVGAGADSTGEEDEDLSLEDLEESKDLPSGASDDDGLRYRIELFLNERWMICTDHVTMQIVLAALDGEHTAPSKFEKILAASKKRLGELEPVKILYRSPKLAERENETLQVAHLKQKYYETEQDEQLDAILKAGPDELGVYDAIESKNDAVVVIEQLLSSALKEAFGTTISLSCVDQYNFHIIGQYYSKTQ